MADNTSKFPIHEAARDGRTTVVESLLNANTKLASQRDDDGRLPIHWAISYGHLDIALLLAQRKDFDPDVQDGSGWTPLMIAVSLKEGDDLVSLLLNKGADVNQTNFSGQTALHFVASKSYLHIARQLLSSTGKPDALAKVKDKRGQCAIHRAAAVGSSPMVGLLLENKSPLNASDTDGYTPLHHAIAEGHGDTAVALLRAGARTDEEDVDKKLAIELAPDTQVRDFIIQTAKHEGIEIPMKRSEK